MNVARRLLSVLPRRLQALTAALSLFGAGLVCAAPPPLKAYFQEAALTQPKLSPDGRHVAMMSVTDNGRQNLVVINLDTLKPMAVGGASDRDLHDLHWVNDRRLIYRLRVRLTAKDRSDGGPGLFAVDVDGENFRQLIDSWWARYNTAPLGVPPLSVRHFLLDVPGAGMGDDVYVAIAGEVSRRKVDYIDVKRLNTRTGRSTDVELPLHGKRWLFGQDAQPLAVLTAQDGRSAWNVRQADGGWLTGPSFDPIGDGGMSLQYQSPDGTLYGVAGHKGFDAPFVFNPATMRPVGAPLVAVPGFSVSPHYVANDRKLLGLRFLVDAEVTHWLDPELKALQDTVDKLLPATSNRLNVPHHGDSPWVLVQAFSDAQPNVAYLYNRSTRKLSRLGQSLPGVDPRLGGQTDFHRVKARDGLPLPVYLTLPPGGGKQHPLLVLVHGGPWVRGANWHFDPEVQFLASRGYAVLEPAFRGSTGYGRAHLEAGFGQWGLAMQDDLVDAVRWAVAQGHADGKRVCIAGASYGGYATLMGLARDGEVFRCGVAWVAVSDPLLLFDKAWTGFNEEAIQYELTRLVGDPVADETKLKAASPLRQAARITQPVLLAYGASDYRVPIVHGERLRDALKPHNPNVEWVVYDNEGHGWNNVDNRIDFWTRVEKFLARHLAAPEGAK
jgi:dipeptidyl aminopeptidase/acylaminoacyl peptidase